MSQEVDLDTLDLNGELFARLEKRYKLQVPTYARYFLRCHLRRVQESLAMDDPVERASRVRLAKKIRPFLDELKEQRHIHEAGQPCCDGYLTFFFYLENFRDLDNGWAEDQEQLTEHPCDVERILQRLCLELERSKIAGSRGRKSKEFDREHLYGGLAFVFEDSGGTVTAYYSAAIDAVDSPFVRFSEDILKVCPADIRSFFLPNHADAIRQWHRKVRASSISQEELEESNWQLNKFRKGIRSRENDARLMQGGK